MKPGPLNPERSSSSFIRPCAESCLSQPKKENLEPCVCKTLICITEKAYYMWWALARKKKGSLYAGKKKVLSCVCKKGSFCDVDGTIKTC